MYCVQIFGVGLLGKPGYNYRGMKALREYTVGLTETKRLWERGGYILTNCDHDKATWLCKDLRKAGVHCQVVHMDCVTLSINVSCPLSLQGATECASCHSSRGGKCIPNGVHNEPSRYDKITPQDIHEDIFGKSPKEDGCAIVRRTRKSSHLCGSETYCRSCTYNKLREIVSKEA